MAAMPVYARAKFGSSCRGLLERIERLLELARELFVNAERVLVNGLEGCGGKSSADLVELHRGWRGVAQSLANRRRQLGKARSECPAYWRRVISDFASTLPLTASRAIAEISYLSPRKSISPVITALTPWFTATSRADCSSSLSVGLRKFLGQLARIAATVDVDKAGAFQGHTEHRLQRVIQNRVAGMVRKVANQHRDRAMRDGFRGLLPPDDDTRKFRLRSPQSERP